MGESESSEEQPTAPHLGFGEAIVIMLLANLEFLLAGAFILILALATLLVAWGTIPIMKFTRSPLFRGVAISHRHRAFCACTFGRVRQRNTASRTLWDLGFSSL